MLEALTTDVRLVTAADVDRYEQLTGWLLDAALGPEETLVALDRLAAG